MKKNKSLKYLALFVVYIVFINICQKQLSAKNEVIRLEYKSINKYKNSFSLISQTGKKNFIKTINNIDNCHIESILKKNITINFVENKDTNLIKYTKNLPEKFPKFERSFVYTLEVQKIMLDKLLKITNINQYNKIENKLRTSKIRSKEERVFFDSRDKFLAKTIDLLSKINLLQNSLGAKKNISKVFPVKAKKMQDIEKYIINQLIIIKENANYIRNKNN